MKTRALLGLVASLAMLASNTPSYAQSATITKDEIQGSINAGNNAANTPATNLPSVLPGYSGDATDLQSMYGKSQSELAVNGNVVGATNGQSSLNTASATYKGENAIDPNADWIKNALNVQDDPQGTTDGVGQATNTCSPQTQTSTTNTHSLYTCEEGTKVTTASNACSTTTTAVSGYACTKSWVDGHPALVSSSACNTLSSTSGCTQTGQTCTTASTYETAKYNCYVGNTYSTANSTCYANWVDGRTPLVPDSTCSTKAADSTCTKSNAVCVTASTYENASYNCYAGKSYSSSQSTCSSNHSYSEQDTYLYGGIHDTTPYGESEDATIFIYTCSGNGGVCLSQGNSAGCTQYSSGKTYYICPRTPSGGGNWSLIKQYSQSYQKFVNAGCSLKSSTAQENKTYSIDSWLCGSQVSGGSLTQVVKNYTDNGSSSTCGSLASNSSCSKSGTTCTQTIDAGVAAYFGLDPNTCVASTDTYTCTTVTAVNYCDPAPSGSGWSCSLSGTSYQSSGGVANAIKVTSYSCSKEHGVNGCQKEQDTYSCTTKTPVNYCEAAPTGSGWSCSKSGTSYQSSGGVSNAVTVTAYSCTKENGVNGCKVETDTYSCNNPVSGAGNATSYTQTTNSSACNSYSSNGACVQTGKTCVKWNSVPSNLQGTYGTQTCAQYDYTYDCQVQGGTTSSCEVPNTGGQVCTWTQDTCLTTDSNGKCTTTEKVYDCVTSVTTNISGQVCKASWQVGDTGIEVTDDTENTFGQSAGAINALAAAAQSFRASGNISVFAGDDLRCKKAIFGLYNCCKDSGLLLDANIVGCSSDEKKLITEQKDKATHYIGTYCSNKSFFGTCLEKKMTYCGFGSVLARVIAEAGYKQLNKSWGDAKTPNCNGFTIDEFSQLDLTNVDFSEFYSIVMAKVDTTGGASQTSSITASITNMMTNKSPTK